MLGAATSSLPVRLSLMPRTINRLPRHANHALRHEAIAAVAHRPPDARAQGDRPQDGLAPPGALAGAPADARVPRRDRPGDEARRPAAAELSPDLRGAGGAAARSPALSLRPEAARRSRRGRALGGRGPAGRAA